MQIKVDIAPLSKIGNICGIDFGLKDFVILSDGTIYGNSACVVKEQ